MVEQATVNRWVTGSSPVAGAKNFCYEKNYSLLGGAGFIAHHTIKYFLQNTDWEIVSLDRLDYSGNLNRIHDMMDDLGSDVKKDSMLYHDLRAEVNHNAITDLGQFNYIIHMAASSHVDRSIEDPMCFVLDNVVATCNILNFSQWQNQNNLERFVYFSTDEVFGPAPAVSKLQRKR